MTRRLARAFVAGCVVLGLSVADAQAGGHMRIAVGVLPIGTG